MFEESGRTGGDMMRSFENMSKHNAFVRWEQGKVKHVISLQGDDEGEVEQIREYPKIGRRGAKIMTMDNMGFAFSYETDKEYEIVNSMIDCCKPR